jgi:hypothetical protein
MNLEDLTDGCREAAQVTTNWSVKRGGSIAE